MSDIIERLQDIAEHDWRKGHLAHTSDTASEADGVIQNLRAALSELSAVYTSCFDLVDGGLIIMQPSVERFEKANAAARKALGFNDVSFEDEE